MEKEDDIQLIDRILSGDDTAFGALVEKHQNSIHALAWRKIGDFHIAEEITQDTFLQVYKNLRQLRNPNQLAGWMYVIADRLCLKWLEKNKKNKPVMQSLEDTPVEEIERVSYTHHVAEQRETEDTEHRHELVKKLLTKLPESERTVVTLYYLGKMTTKEISKFLGVSVHTITSRLQRARKRLQEQQEVLIQEVLGGVRIPASLGENIMRQVADMAPTPSPASKPFLPWMALGTAAVLIALLLGASNRYLTRFQKPYSFDAQSEPTIEIVDTPIILDIAAKPAVRNQVGSVTTPGETSRAGTQVSDVTSTSTAPENFTQLSTAQWQHGNGPPAGPVRNIFATSDGTVYAVIQTGIYRLTADATVWTRVDASVQIDESLMPMAEHNGMLCIVATDEIFASENRGETWNTLGPRPKGDAVELVITDAERVSSQQAPITMYLALRDRGIFRSTDGGAQWSPVNDGLIAEKISAMAAIGKTVFAGTEKGLYRLDSGIWKKLPLDTSGAICSLAVSGTKLYAGIGHEILVRLTRAEREGLHEDLHFTEIFRSTDLGASWTEIRLRSKHLRETSPAGITVLATGETLLALSYAQSRSTDGGQTWTGLEDDQNFLGRSRLPAVMVNERTYYKANFSGIHRTTDGGVSWHIFMNGVMGTAIRDLVAFNNRLYAHTGYEVYQSTDGGVSWKKLWNHGQEAVLTIPTTRISAASKLIPVDDILYSLSAPGDDVGIFRLSSDSDMLIPVQGVPVFDRYKLGSEKFYKSKDQEDARIDRLRIETAAASRDVFYVEYIGELFKWKLGDSEWTSTGFVDDSYRYDEKFGEGFKLAVLEKTVYVGKREGKLFQSLDEGSNWKDITSNLPLRFTRFKDMVFVKSTLYVATDNGVMVSQTGEQWLVLTDNARKRPIINNFATNGIRIYGISDMGVYRLDTRSQWKQVSTEVPDGMVFPAITNNRLYGVVQGQGILHSSLAEER